MRMQIWSRANIYPYEIMSKPTRTKYLNTKQKKLDWNWSYFRMASGGYQGSSGMSIRLYFRFLVGFAKLTFKMKRRTSSSR